MRQTPRTRPRFARAASLPTRSTDSIRTRKTSRKAGRFVPILIIGATAAVFIAILVYVSVLSGSSHPAVGKWKAGFLVLRVTPNKSATINGVVCSWSKVDDNTILIQPSAKIGDPEWGTIEVAFEFMVQPGGQQAIAEILGFPMTLDRDQ